MSKTRTAIAAFAATLALAATPAGAQSGPTEQAWDGLVRVPSRNIDAAYLAPGADFRPYTKVMIDPTEAAFQRNWQRDYNRTSMGLSARVTDAEARDALQLVQSGFQEALTQAYTSGGYQVVTTPGPDVLRLRTAVMNITVSAPDQMSAGRTRTYTEDAGTATLVVEARDSMSGAILGRAVDARTIDDHVSMMWRNRATNRADFMRTFRRWADLSVEATNRLRTTAPPAATAPAS